MTKKTEGPNVATVQITEDTKPIIDSLKAEMVKRVPTLKPTNSDAIRFGLSLVVEALKAKAGGTH